ncbi:MAG: permease prefix domain 1-containing protein [Planctomycetota bacterium]
MSDFRDLTERATARLRRDRELRLEVTRELESHLEASAAEFRAADYSEDDAHAAAVKAFGDPEDVAQQLWEANRFRLRLRAWGWWAARVSLLPACVAAVVWFVMSGITAPPVQQMRNMESGWAAEPTWLQQRVRARMTPTQRLIYFGDEAADNPVTAAKGLRDAYPDEPLYQLNYLTTMLNYYRLPGDERTTAAWHRRITAADVLREAERGRALDPDNGIYGLIEASVWVEPWFELEGDPAITFTKLDARAEPGSPERTEVVASVFAGEVDEGALAEALAALERAAAKPYVSAHSVDMLRHRLEQLPPPRSLQEYLFRVGGEIGTLLPTLGHRRKMARVVTCEAIRRARAGDRAGAIGLLDTLDMLNAKLAAADDTLIGFLVSWSIEVLEHDTRVVVYRVLGDGAAAESALAEADALALKYQREWGSPEEGETTEEKVRQGGFLMNALLPAIPGYDIDVAPFRKAEYALFDRAALTVGLIGLIVGSALLSLSGLMGGWRRRRKARRGLGVSESEGAILLWVGWRRLAWVLAGAVGLPLLGFMGWTALPWSGRGYGLNHSWEPVLAYGPMALLIAALLWVLGGEALRQRAKEVGLAVPGPARWWVSGSVAAGLMLGLWGWTQRLVVLSALPDDDMKWMLAYVGALVWGAGLWVAVAWSLAKLNGAASRGGAVARGLGRGVLMGLGFGAAVGGAVWWMSDPIDREAFLVMVVVVAVLLGLGAGWLWIAGRPGATERFARSAMRSLGSVVAAAGLVLVLTAGPALTWWERALVRGVVERTPVWVDQEIEKSNAKMLRAFLAGDEIAPPQKVPGVDSAL